jgi:hypothetical protein
MLPALSCLDISMKRTHSEIEQQEPFLELTDETVHTEVVHLTDSDEFEGYERSILKVWPDSLGEYENDLALAIYKRGAKSLIVAFQMRYDNFPNRYGPLVTGTFPESLGRLGAAEAAKAAEAAEAAEFSESPGRLGTGDEVLGSPLLLNATRWWWRERTFGSELPLIAYAELIPQASYNELLLKKGGDGFVTVDLWHTARGYNAFPDGKRPLSLREFKDEPTFFFGSYGLVMDHLDDLNDYCGEPEEEEDGRLFVKRARFRFKPLLWFDDTSVDTLLQDPQKSSGVLALLQAALGPQKDPRSEARKAVLADNSPENKTKKQRLLEKMLYHRRRLGRSGEREKVELRLDNNCVDEGAKLASEEKGGFHGTLAVDVSGFGVLGGPGCGELSSESVVLWNVATTLKEEWPWELVDV